MSRVRTFDDLLQSIDAPRQEMIDECRRRGWIAVSTGPSFNVPSTLDLMRPQFYRIENAVRTAVIERPETRGDDAKVPDKRMKVFRASEEAAISGQPVAGANTTMTVEMAELSRASRPQPGYRGTMNNAEWAVTAFLKQLRQDAELAQSVEELRPRLAKQWEQIAREMQVVMAEWEAEYGASYPTDVADFIRYAVRAGLEPECVRAGEWTWRDVSPYVEGWLERCRALQRVEQPTDELAIAHSRDFACVVWRDTTYQFTKNQAACVRVLYEEWERGTPVIGQEAILDAAGVSQQELRKVFSGHEAWGTLIVSPSKGRFRLAEPTAKESQAGG